MRKTISFSIACILAVCTVAATFSHLGGDDYLDDLHEKLYFMNMDRRNSSRCIMAEALKNADILMLGSSELSARDEIGFPQYLFGYENSDFRPLMAGRGHMQSLRHAICVGALGDIVPNKKVVLILSPQWFGETNITGEAFESTFSVEQYEDFLRNEQLSNELKERVSARIREIIGEGNSLVPKLGSREHAYMSNAPFHPQRFLISAESYFSRMKSNYKFRQLAESFTYSTSAERVRAETLDYDNLLARAEAEGRAECTNNEFGVYDDYYTKYMEGALDARKGSQTGSSYCSSDEYRDLELFLQVCKETGIKPMLVSMPVNGRWYDYTGFPQWDRERYYQNIRDLAAKHGAKLADFSDREYELYFLKDIMHCGWKGWVNIDEAVYRFYKED